MTKEEAEAEFKRIVTLKKVQDKSQQYAYTQGENKAIGGTGTITIEESLAKKRLEREETKYLN